MKRSYSRIILLILISAVSQVKAQGPSLSIRINHLQLQTTSNLQAFNGIRSIYLQDTVNGFFYTFLQFENLPNEKQREEISALTGITFIGYLPQNTYYVRVPVDVNVAPLYNF
jgi:hypothetical protein